MTLRQGGQGERRGSATLAQMADGEFDDFPFDDEEAPDPDRLRECEYWRCGELFEMRTANQIFCRKACRSRQRKWERAQARRARRGAGTGRS